MASNTPSQKAHRLSFHKEDFRLALLEYYQTKFRPLPWRQKGTTAYETWVSEIMLQQTTVAAVVPYYLRFLKAFPTLEDLARCEEQQVFHLWQGLGYYSRARNLLKCAKVVVEKHGSFFPNDEKALQELPGIGPYTAAAIAAQAFGKPATVVDGNVERVMARLFLIKTPLPAAKPDIRAYAEQLTCPQKPGLYANAIMELGATVCTPKKPACTVCPVPSFCKARLLPLHEKEGYPRKIPKAPKPQKQGIAWVIRDANGRIFLRQRPDKGLLAKLWEVPHTGWEPAGKKTDALCSVEGVVKQVERAEHVDIKECGRIQHVFTHFGLSLDVREVSGMDLEKVSTLQGAWFSPDNLPPLPTLMQKVLDIQKGA